MHSLFDVTDKVILVTGGANGIGKGIAVGLAGLGARVTVWDRDETALRNLVDHANGAGTRIETDAIDVTDENAIIAGMARIASEIGPLDAVFVNAGISGKAQPFEDYTLANWQQVHAVNLDGAFLTAREAARHMKPRRKGKIIFTSSVWGERGASGAPLAAYMSSKGAIHNLTRQMARELANYGINVNAVSPAGFITTLGAGELEQSFGDWLVAKIAMNRMVEPSEMVGPAAFLASRASDWITGATLPVDGGFLAE